MENQIKESKTYNELEQHISEKLIEMGILPHLKGYRFLIQAILICYEDLEILGMVTKKLYPTIADNFGTTPTSVERTIRHAIGKTPIVKTNSQFIGEFAEKLKYR